MNHITQQVPDVLPMAAGEAKRLLHVLEDNLNQVILGKPDVVRLCLTALVAGEHLLLEDVPGVGKTLVGKAIARCVDGVFSRIQFTPDLLPSDIVGSSIFNAKTAEFTFNQGPIFSNIVLADEINRAPPRTQSALLEAMSDRQISADGSTYPLVQPFMVIATQNPFEFEGTYMLPESQMDRFLLRISMGYPDRDSERLVLESHRKGQPVDELRPVVNCHQIVSMQAAVRTITVEPSIHDYLLDIVGATRTSEEVHVGVSTRGALSLYRAAQARALIEGRDFVTPDDIKSLAVPVFAHRLLTKGFLRAGSKTAVELLMRRLVEETRTPN